MIGFYLIFMFVITGAMVTAAVLLFMYGGEIGNKETEVGRTVSNVVLKAYSDCCNPTVPMLPCKLEAIASILPLYTCYYPVCKGDNADFCAAMSSDQIPTFNSDMCSGIRNGLFTQTENKWANACMLPTTWGEDVEGFVLKYLKVGTSGMIGLAATLVLLFLLGVG